MLERLCAYDCDSDEAAEIYFAIDADDKSNHYNPNEFSYFEKRLLALQDYVRGHSPHSLRALWYDRRNLSWWWTFWAVIFFGAPTVILTLVQVGQIHVIEYRSSAKLTFTYNRRYWQHYNLRDHRFVGCVSNAWNF
jgi:hypothetical protein